MSQSAESNQARPPYSEVDFESSPPRRLESRSSSQALQTAAFSASQTALLGRDGSMSGSFSPTISNNHGNRRDDNGNEIEPDGRCDATHRRSSKTALESLLMSRSPALDDSPVIGMAFTTEISPSASLGDSFASHSQSMHTSNTNESLLRERSTPQIITEGSIYRSPTQTPRPFCSALSAGRSPITASTMSFSDFNSLTSSPRSTSLGEKFDSSGVLSATVVDYNFVDFAEEDDDLHAPDAAMKKGKGDKTGTILTPRGFMNIGFLFLLAFGLMMLFAGYPIFTTFLRKGDSKKGAYNLGGTNATGQVPSIPGLPSLIDPDTPKEFYLKKSADGSKTLKLVFSDEFNTAGRSFYPGDDPFWEAVDLNYWGTQNYEWYDPAAVTTVDGSLVITLSETPIHNLNFRGGMVTSWNKLCFTGGQIEVKAMLPGSPDISGTWPAAWTMGNLGRAGYGATTDGMWPYTYDSCDVGTLANQTYPKSKGGGPIAAETTGVYVKQYGPGLSYLPGQRLSRCTCHNSKDHPGPRHSDGSFVGRSAPEIDIFEAQASNTKGDDGHVSMSLQLAPYDSGYNLTKTPGSFEFYDAKIAHLNDYTGAVYQQAASGLVNSGREAYEDNGAQFDTWGFEYRPGGDPDSYITWLSGGKAVWRLNSGAIGPNAATEVGQRVIPMEPMYILLNLGISSSFTYGECFPSKLLFGGLTLKPSTSVNWKDLHFPAKLRIDHVRIWQPEDEENIGCDPPSFPTKDYIEKHYEAYHNPNLTTWTRDPSVGGYGQQNPGNSMLDQC